MIEPVTNAHLRWWILVTNLSRIPNIPKFYSSSMSRENAEAAAKYQSSLPENIENRFEYSVQLAPYIIYRDGLFYSAELTKEAADSIVYEKIQDDPDYAYIIQYEE